MNIFWYIFIIYALISLYETVKTANENGHIWQASKPQFIMMLIISAIFGGLKGLLDFIKKIIELLEPFLKGEK